MVYNTIQVTRGFSLGGLLFVGFVVLGFAQQSMERSSGKMGGVKSGYELKSLVTEINFLVLELLSRGGNATKYG
jgi:hypothetical protein